MQENEDHSQISLSFWNWFLLSRGISRSAVFILRDSKNTGRLFSINKKLEHDSKYIIGRDSKFK